jgi:hypothetical protein
VRAASVLCCMGKRRRLRKAPALRRPSSYVLGLGGVGATMVTSPLAVLSTLPTSAWVAMLGIGGLMIAGAIWLYVGECRHPRDSSTPLSRLRRVLAEGMGLRTFVMMDVTPAYWKGDEMVGGERLPISREDPLYLWAKKAWEALRDLHPEAADEFYGEDAPMGSGFFMLGYSTEVGRDGRADYLERRIALLRRVIDGVSEPRPDQRHQPAFR